MTRITVRGVVAYSSLVVSRDTLQNLGGDSANANRNMDCALLINHVRDFTQLSSRREMRSRFKGLEMLELLKNSAVVADVHRALGST